MASQLSTQPPSAPDYILSYPSPFVLLITINRVKAMNSIPYAAHWDAAAVLDWFDDEPTLRVAVVTGAGTKAFCAGQDLIEQGEIRKKPQPRQMMQHPSSGFMGVSRRVGKKPILAAVNGFALGGGFEIVLGCDMVVASPTAKFGLPEALRGLYAGAGGLSRLVRIVGLPIASEIAMAGRTLSADEAVKFNVVNRISATPESVVDEAVKLASTIAGLSPDAIIVTRHGLREALETGSVERASQITQNTYGRKLVQGDNIGIGLEAFAKKTQPKWVPSKL
ncbi:ClpP/crotonase [Aulographum hederae CBS 113979]|uniref:ClpP/crotonase n=1 Tax=Aulographum hederae CBS 113979 TaxID=1176131 RepID=A0A6G1GST7_9PEZI|nr:ClpP/crotonase [Aulographum hederae CBS 113979]